MRMIRAFILAMILMPIPFTYGQEISDYDRFQLFNNCEPVRLFIEELSLEETNIRLLKQDIETTVRSRLRAARLYNSDSSDYGAFISVQVNVLTIAFSFTIQLYKPMLDLRSGQYSPAIAWQDGGFGTTGNDPTFVMSAVSQYTDKFIDEYLRVNEVACG